jgi:UDP-N-acetylglucosamine--N-acetylmuramyl-(pentapeptide) pyrophosphoryl-undecaprenol N-acetylglucosamine transferase
MNSDSNKIKQPLRVLFAGGGTGGHVYPALAIAQTLRNRYPDAEILFVGTADRMEAEKVPAAGFTFRSISVHGLAGKWTLGGLLKRLCGAAEIVSGLPVWQSLGIIRRFHPNVVVGTGGYVCGPVIAAAWLSKIPAMLVEQNEKIGWTSRMVAPFIRVATVTSAEAGDYFSKRKIRTEVIGNPVRPAVLLTTRQEGITALGLAEGRSTLSIVGGSLGSTPVNNAAVAAIRLLSAEPWFRDGWQVVHLVGKDRGGGISANEASKLEMPYFTYPFIDNIHNLLAASDVVITRAGGTFLAEIAARGIPMIIIPWSGAADDHQTRNALPFTQSGAGVVILDNELSEESLSAALKNILPNREQREAMSIASRQLGKPESAQKCVNILQELAGYTDGTFRVG